MADEDGIFTRLGLMLDKGTDAVVKKEKEIPEAFANAVNEGPDKLDNTRLGRMLDKGFERLDNATDHHLSIILERGKLDEAIFGSESVHSAPKPPATPSVPKAAKRTNLKEM